MKLNILIATIFITTQTLVATPRFAISSPEAIAGEIAAAILIKGGNAVDAAIALHFALAVTYPSAGNIGGGGFAIIRDPSGKYFALDFRETAPRNANSEMFYKNGKIVEDLSLYSGKAVGTPGSVAGMVELYKMWGTLEWEDLLKPAIELAENGFIANFRFVQSVAAAQRKFEKSEIASQYSNFRRYFNPKLHKIFTQKELASTLKLIAKDPNNFYKGKIANLIVKTVQSREGVITLEDLKSYKAIWRQPIKINYQGYAINTMPLPSAGGIALAQLLKITSKIKLPKPYSAEQIKKFAEIEKEVFKDRRFLGDPDFVKIDYKSFLTDEQIERKIKVLNSDTTHYSIIDHNKMAISITTTLNTSYGSGIVVEGGGFLLNNEIDDFAIDEHYTNIYGLPGSKANLIEGNKRMVSSMTPTIIEKEDTIIALGSPGGPTIITTIFQVIINHINYKFPLYKAVTAPRFHSQWWGNEKTKVLLEKYYPYLLPKTEINTLEDNYKIEIDYVDTLGDVQIAGVKSANFFAIDDPRRPGIALVSNGER